MKAFTIFTLLGLLPAGLLCAATDSQTVTLDHKLQIPGATLKSGEYTFQVEDRLQDRAIIRITDTKKNSHELLLAVPNEKLNQTERSQLIFFPNGNSDKQILEGWMCPSCQSALQVVYPKAEAVKITAISAKPVLAVDPTYDKLPKNLSADDMKVVTLWLLSPKEVTPDQKGKGLEAAKWADVNAPKKTEMAEARPPAAPAEASTTPSAPGPASSPSAPEAPASASAPASSAASAAPAAAPTPESAAPSAPAAAPTPEPAAPSAPAAATAPEPTAPAATPAAPAASTAPAAPAPAVAPAAPTPDQVASAAPENTSTPRRMPHTASSTYTFGLVGILLLSAGLGMQLQRRLRGSASNE